MPIMLDIREIDDVVVIECPTRITLGGGSGDLRHTIRRMVDADEKKVVLNLAETNFMDTTGLGEMCRSLSTLTSCGAELKLLAPKDQIKKLLQCTKLDTLFNIHETETDAIRSFE